MRFTVLVKPMIQKIVTGMAMISGRTMISPKGLVSHSIWMPKAMGMQAARIWPTSLTLAGILQMSSQMPTTTIAVQPRSIPTSSCCKGTQNKTAAMKPI